MLLPTFIVFLTNDSSNMAIFAATKKSSLPKYSQPPPSIYPCSNGESSGPSGMVPSNEWDGCIVYGGADDVTKFSVVAQ